ncbi:MAG: 30S ribosomal protein S12 methylthiotransferase RimO [Bacteroidales bacterium]|jgi:ribosomal protein S12 methylthiotransferase|nr:30S ribosomal protein S12 methylthiotransferase RimO [Bacteroidales bacterium]MDI9576312.1 30S ribosomal protein S12 methylthiotransferase RimO [Bacteroidota bacterium]MDY0401029.1 30S ribosomal protein S12 methylthiotransferase RimO [Bacteroidales bacterium]HHW59895.1 30S ribosomal protein S12 methylthiotransferase RimO [Bacteroidales bacterium]HOB78222.1 30S ribosomal protein S12 methylthiotransferase RimO [Bacteroidales bacterium]
MIDATLSIITLGCPKNQVDSERLAAALSPYFNVKHESPIADYVIINTCSFILPAREESINMILDYIDFKKQGLIKKLIVIGCMPQIHKEELQKNLPEVDIFAKINEYDTLVKTLSENQDAKIGQERILSTPNHYAYLKIADGCDHSCSFCAIPLIRGRYRSIPIEILIDEAKTLAAKGVKELIIIAQDTTYYGLDIYHEQKLPELLDAVASLNLFPWIRLLYTYPINFPLELIDVFNTHKSIVPYIHLPLQHCDHEILINMRRPFDEESIKQLIYQLKSKIPNLAIRTEFITGYPIETTQIFNKLKKFIKEMQFERIGVFDYSDEEGTFAALLPQLKVSTRIKRAQELINIHEELSFLRNKSLIGKTIKAMVDKKNEETGIYEARSQWDAPEIDQIVFIFSKKELNPGDIVDVYIDDAGIFDLSGIYKM